MKHEQILPQDGSNEPQISQQLDIDFESAAKRAAIEARAKELRKNEDITMPYARDLASQVLKREEWDERAKKKEKSN